jgi:hypothetical protein
MSNVGHSWEPITNLPDDWFRLAREDLTLIHKQWIEEKSILKDASKIRALEERLATEWAIETGIIERLYTVDRGVTESLIELGLENISQLHSQGKISRDAMEVIEDQKMALEFVFQFIRQERRLTSAYVRELHLALTRHQEETEVTNSGIDS